MHCPCRAASLVIVAFPLLAASVGAQSATTPRWAASIDSMMARELPRSGTPGAQVAVARNGRVVFVKSYGVTDVETKRPVTDRTIFQTGSVGKLLTAVLVAELASRGALDLRAPVSRQVTELAGREVGAATLHELLTHSAGWRTTGSPWGRSDDAALGEVFRALGDTILTPGLKGFYSYSNPSFEMAAYVAERAAGRAFATLLDSILFRPLGMPQAALRPMIAMTRDFALGHEMPLTPAAPAGNGAASPPLARSSAVVRPMPGNSAEWGAGFVYLNAAEAARLAIALMDGGVLDGRRVLSADAVRAVTTGYVPRPSTPGGSAGYGMNADTIGGRVMWQKGGSQPGFRSLLTMWPAEKVAVVVFANQRSDITYHATAFIARAVAGISVPASPIPPRGAEREPTAAERAALVGSYRMGRGNIVIHEANGRLELRRINYSVPIRMTGTDRFVVTTPGGETVGYVVLRDSSGAIGWLHAAETTFPRIAAQ